MSISHAWLRPFALALVLLLSGFLLSPDTASGSRAHRKHEIHRAVVVARNQIGDPYVYGAAGPSAFDCSGLTMYAYAKAGISLPRTAGEQAAAVRRIGRHHMRKGDLVFFYNRGGIYHEGIFTGWRAGRRVVLHAPYSGRNVERQRIWTSHWFGGTLRRHH